MDHSLKQRFLRKASSLRARVNISARMRGLRLLSVGLRLGHEGSPIDCVPLKSFEEFNAWRDQQQAELQKRRAHLLSLQQRKGLLSIPAFCVCCQQPRYLLTDNLLDTPPNWRESLICSSCRFSSRLRACVLLLREKIGPTPDANIYITEQVTGVYQWFLRHFPRTVGSEYLRDGTPSGELNPAGIRHEDLTNLTFQDASKDLIVSFEVCEHIPNFQRAFAECARVLKPGGALLLSVPFHAGPKHLTRAALNDDGSINHLEPPEYHGDPLSEAGCLCFHHFGWDILGHLKAAGFKSAQAYAIWSVHSGYLASEGYQIHFIAIK